MHTRIQIYWCRSSIFRHLKLELLTQFPASNDEKHINVVYIWRKFVSFYGYVHWRMTTEISVMYGSEKVNDPVTLRNRLRNEYHRTTHPAVFVVFVLLLSGKYARRCSLRPSQICFVQLYMSWIWSLFISVLWNLKARVSNPWSPAFQSGRFNYCTRAPTLDWNENKIVLLRRQGLQISSNDNSPNHAEQFITWLRELA